MNINALAINPGPAIFYDPDFRNVLEDHLTKLKSSVRTITVNVDPMLAYRFEYSFYALLNALNVPVFKHWITLRMLGYRSQFDVDRTITTIYVPSDTELNQLAQSHTSARKLI